MNVFHNRLGEELKNIGIKLGKNSFTKSALEKALQLQMTTVSEVILKEKKRCYDLVLDLIKAKMATTCIHKQIIKKSKLIFFFELTKYTTSKNMVGLGARKRILAVLELELMTQNTMFQTTTTQIMEEMSESANNIGNLLQVE